MKEEEDEEGADDEPLASGQVSAVLSGARAEQQYSRTRVFF